MNYYFNSSIQNVNQHFLGIKIYSLERAKKIIRIKFKNSSFDVNNIIMRQKCENCQQHVAGFFISS